MEKENNKLGKTSVGKLILQLGLPMVLSMVLQAIYNVVDTVFVINSDAGTYGNAALTAAFPIQILMIAVGVGTRCRDKRAFIPKTRRKGFRCG